MKMNKELDELWLDLEMDLDCYNKYVANKYNNRGFMNTLTTDKIYSLLSRIVKLNVIPVENEDSEENFSFQEDDIIIN
jgi:hypothetical protein